MKKLGLILCFFSMMGWGGLAAQDCEISLMALAKRNDSTPEAALKYMVNRLCNSVCRDGVAASSDYSQFIVVAEASPLFEDVAPGPPAKIALRLSVDLYIADQIGKKVFESVNMEMKGVGETKERAYINALKGLNGNNRVIAGFISDGKNAIVNYYDTQYPNIIKEAERNVALKNYEKALFDLCAVPVCCKGYDRVSDVIVKVYKEYIDYNCSKLIMKARTAWAESPDSYGAGVAGEYLNMIDPSAECYGDAMSLYKEIKNKVKDDWNFEMREKYKDELGVRKQLIEAAKAVGVAYGNGQQPVTTNIMWLRR